jgi:hypothetical protein
MPSCGAHFGNDQDRRRFRERGDDRAGQLSQFLDETMADDVEAFWVFFVLATVVIVVALWPGWPYTRSRWPYSRGGVGAYLPSAVAAIGLLLGLLVLWFGVSALLAAFATV